jgi:hypothetical protein
MSAGVVTAAAAGSSCLDVRQQRRDTSPPTAPSQRHWIRLGLAVRRRHRRQPLPMTTSPPLSTLSVVAVIKTDAAIGGTSRRRQRPIAFDASIARQCLGNLVTHQRDVTTTSNTRKLALSGTGDRHRADIELLPEGCANTGLNCHPRRASLNHYRRVPAVISKTDGDATPRLVSWIWTLPNEDGHRARPRTCIGPASRAASGSRCDQLFKPGIIRNHRQLHAKLRQLGGFQLRRNSVAINGLGADKALRHPH